MNSKPILKMNNQTIKVGDNINVSNWITVSDPDRNDRIEEIALFDDTAGGGYFFYNGQKYDGTNQGIRIYNVNDLQKITYVAGPSGGVDTLRINASDGTDWAYTQGTFKPTVTTNSKPILTMSNQTLQVGQQVKISDWVTVRDPDGNSQINEIALFDDTAGGGYFFYNGQKYDGTSQGLRIYNINDLQKITYVAGASSGTDTLRMNASDGIEWAYTQGSFKPTVTTVSPTPTNQKPTLTMSNQTLQVGQTAQLSGWVSVSDPNGVGDIQEIIIIDNTLSGGHLSYNGRTYDAGQELHLSNVNELQNVTYVAGNSGGKDTLWVNARDKTLWANNGEGVTRTVTTEAPATSNTLQVLAENRIVTAARDLVKNGGDRDGDGTTDYGVSGCTPMMKEIMRLSVGPWKGGQGSYDNNLKSKLNHFSDASDDAFTTIYAGNNDVISSSGGIADLAARLRPGDVINYYHSWTSGEDVHSTIVTSVTSDTIMVIDNLGTGGQPIERNILQNSKGETVFTIRNPQIVRFDAMGGHNVVDASPDLTYINDKDRSGINVNDSIILNGTGANTIDGGDGNDTVILAGLSTDYTITHPDNATVVLVKNGVTDTIKNVESLKFDDTTQTGAVPSFQSVQTSLSGTTDGQTVLFQQVNINTVADPSRGPLISKVLANGKEVTGIPSTLKEGWKAAATVDLAGNGNTALFLYGVSNVQGVGAGNGATWSVNAAGAVNDTKMQLKMSVAGWDVAGKANINGIDGDEILWQNAINGYKALWTDTNHDGIVDLGLVLSGLGTDTRESIIGVSDINGNGKKEIALLNKSTNTISLHEVTSLLDGKVSTSSLASYNSYDDLTKGAGSSLTIFPFITKT